LITDRERFVRVWTDVAPRLQRFLTARAVNPADIDDVIQETAERVLARDIAYRDADDLFTWCRTVAWRLAITLRRRRARIATTDEAADAVIAMAAADDVAMTVELRQELATVASVFPLLSEHDRAAIVSDAVAEDRREAVKLAVRRHRARVRLLALVDAAVAILVGVGRRLAQPARRTIALAGATAVPIVALVVLALPHLDTRRRPDQLPALAPSGSAPAHNDIRAAARRVDGPAPSANSAPARIRTAAGPSDRPPPVIDSPIHDPSGHRDGHVTVRPREDDDHFICSDALTGSKLCIDPPIASPFTR